MCGTLGMVCNGESFCMTALVYPSSYEYIENLKLSQNVNSKYVCDEQNYIVFALFVEQQITSNNPKGSFALQNLSSTLDISLKSENVNI